LGETLVDRASPKQPAAARVAAQANASDSGIHERAYADPEAWWAASGGAPTSFVWADRRAWIRWSPRSRIRLINPLLLGARCVGSRRDEQRVPRL